MPHAAQATARAVNPLSAPTRGARLLASIESRPAWTVAAFSLFYWASTLFISSAKPLWFDELFTFYIARMPNVTDMLAASPADGHPPLFYLLTKLSHTAFGSTDAATRVPEMLGFWIFSLCLFSLARRIASPSAATLAIVLPMATGAYDYAFQARPYGLVLGFGGLALWAWQRRTETRSSLSLAVLAVGLAGAIMSHYYSVIQVALPLVLAESVRTIQRRRLDWPVALAMAVSAAPLLLVLPTLIEASSVYANFVLHAPQFFAKPRWSNALGFYTYQISAAILPAFIGLLAALVFAQSNKPNPSRRNLTLPESVALLAYAAMPLLMVAFTKWRTGYFRQRYAIMAFAGFTLLLCWAFNRYLPKLAPAAIAAALLVSITLTTLDGGPDGQQVMQWNGPVAAPPGQPVVIANPLRFLVLAHYSTPADRDRLYYLTDRATALTQPDFLPELSLLRGKPWLPGHIVDYHEFIAANPHFLVEYTASPALEWVPRKLSDDSCRLSWLPSSSRNRFLLQALRNP